MGRECWSLGRIMTQHSDRFAHSIQNGALAHLKPPPGSSVTVMADGAVMLRISSG
jgi:hypothetical protein